MTPHTQLSSADLEQGKGRATVRRESRFAFENILHIGKYYPPYDGGMETVLRDLVLRQSRVFPVRVVVANDTPRTVVEFRDGAELTRVARYGTLASQPVCPALPFHIAAGQETLVHLHVPNPWAAQAYLMTAHDGPLVVSHHADIEGRKILRKVTDPAVRRVMERASAIIVSSRRYLETSAELSGFKDKCRVVPLGIELKSFDGAPDEVAAIRAKYGEKIILAVGRLVPYKGFDYLLRSMAKLDATLLIVGSGPLRAALGETAESLGLGAKVQFLGHVADVAPYYKAARLLVMPSVSRAEAFGLVQVEAMAAGIPVVNTDIESGVPDVSLNGVTGITVPPKDAKALADAIDILLTNTEMRLEYGRAGAARARAQFSALRMAQRMLSVYEAF